MKISSQVVGRGVGRIAEQKCDVLDTGKESNVLFPGFLMSNQSVDELIRAKHGEIKQLKVQIKKMKEPKAMEKKKRKDNAKMKDMSESDVEQQEIEVMSSELFLFRLHHHESR